MAVIKNLYEKFARFQENKTRRGRNLYVLYEADTPGDLETPENPRGRESSGRYLFCTLVFLSLVPGTKLENRWKISYSRWISNFETADQRSFLIGSSWFNELQDTSNRTSYCKMCFSVKRKRTFDSKWLKLKITWITNIEGYFMQIKQSLHWPLYINCYWKVML